MLHSNLLNDSIYSLANQLVDAFGLAILHAHKHHIGTEIPKSVSLKKFIDKRFDEIEPKELWRLVHLGTFWNCDLFETEYDNKTNLLTISSIDSTIHFNYFFDIYFFIAAYDNLVLKFQLCKRKLLTSPRTQKPSQKYTALFNHHIEVPKNDFVAYGYFFLDSNGSINFLLRELDPNDYELIIRKKPIGCGDIPKIGIHYVHYVGDAWFEHKREKNILTLSKYLGKAGIKTMSIETDSLARTINNQTDSIALKKEIIKRYYEHYENN